MTHLLAPVKTRLTLAFTCLLAVVITIGGVLMYTGFKQQLNRQIDDELVALVIDNMDDYEEGDVDDLVEMPDAAQRSLFGYAYAPDGSLMDASPGARTLTIHLPDWPRVPQDRLIQTTASWPGSDETGVVRLYAMGAPDGGWIIIGHALAGRDRDLAALRRLLLTGGPILLLVTSALAWVLSAASLRPVEQMRQGAARLSESSPDLRLPVPRTRDEIARLAETLNSLLARLEEAREKERRILDDASHELRTPLAILGIEIELALRRSRTPEELRASLENAAKVSQDLNRLAEDLLVLSRSNRGILEVHRERADLTDLVTQTVASLGPLADQKGVTLQVEAPPDVEAEVDRLRLRQALGNLLENAIHHCPPKGQVTVVLTRGDGLLSLRVSDEGPGFPPGFIDEAFDAFTRADAARTRHKGGAGLGLAIVKGVAEAHGGSVIAGNRIGGGAEVTISFPA